MFFRILWVIDALVSLVVFYFFFEGVTRGTVSSFNIGIWLALLSGIAIILGGSWLCKAKGFAWLGIILLAAPASLALLGLLAILAIIILQPDWR